MERWKEDTSVGRLATSLLPTCQSLLYLHKLSHFHFLAIQQLPRCSHTAMRGGKQPQVASDAFFDEQTLLGATTSTFPTSKGKLQNTSASESSPSLSLSNSVR